MEQTKLVKLLSSFQDAVLTGIDAQGYPVSIRCRPQLDEAASVLRIQLPADIQPVAGPGWLLCHAHDEKLWHLRSFALQGTIEQQPEATLFRVQRLVPGMNMAGAPGPVTTLVRARQMMKRILRQQGLATPAIPWERMKQLADRSK